MNVIRIKICRQTSPYGRVPQNRFWFVPSCGQSIVVLRTVELTSSLNFLFTADDEERLFDM